MPGLLPSTQKGWLKLLYRTCGHHEIIPRTLQVPVSYDRTRSPLCRGGYADVWKEEYHGQSVAVKVIRTYKNEVLQKVIHVSRCCALFFRLTCSQKRAVQRFCKEAVMWRYLQHPNVLSLIGVVMSSNQFAMVSDWMVNGNINEYIQAHPDANRFKLVGPLL